MGLPQPPTTGLWKTRILPLLVLVLLLGVALGEQRESLAKRTQTFTRHRLHNEENKSPSARETYVPNEDFKNFRIRTQSKKLHPSRARLNPDIYDGRSPSLSEANSRRLNFGFARQNHPQNLGHSSQTAHLPLDTDHLVKIRRNSNGDRVSHKRVETFASQNRTLNHLLSDEGLHLSKYLRSPSKESLRDDREIVQHRHDQINGYPVASPLRLSTRSQTAAYQSANNHLLSAREVASMKNEEQAKLQSELEMTGLAKESHLGQEAERDVIHFRGRQLLSLEAESQEERSKRHRRSTQANPDASNETNCTSSAHEEPGVHLVTFRWDVVGVYFTITAFVMFAGLGKLGFHQMHWLSRYVPESCLLIVLGVLMGLLVFFTNLDSTGKCGTVAFPTFDSDSFFFVLLPPIILESAYSLHDRSFIDNIGSVLVFAIFGTLLNIFIIGPSLFGLALIGAMGDFKLDLTESLVFSSLISAVDPVAVLSIFQELGVHKGLYFLVFGESLLNDGVTVVVYNMMSVFMKMTVIEAKDYILSVVSFFVVTLCGTAIGIVFGFITALVTRITTNVRVMEPLALLGFAYLAYLGAELFHFSGIISLIACGLVQAQYAFQNISDKSYTCVKYFTKMASATTETIIFMFLGMVLVSKDHVWHTGFVLWTLLLCFVVRVLITLILSAIVNHYRVRRIGLSEQLILAYGGLRGAVAFSLVSMLPNDEPLKELFITATLVVILFTVFVQGITMAPLVRWLDVAKRRRGPRILFEEVHVSVVDHMMAGIEEVLGEHGDFYIMAQLRVYDEKYLKKWFVRPTCEAPLKRLFEKIAITEHYAHLYGPAELIQQHDMDIYSSKTKLVEGTASNAPSNRASVQILTTDDGEGQKLEQLKLEQASPKPELKRRKSSVASILPGWGDGNRRASTISSTHDNIQRQLEEDARLLRRAISSNPYNQFHYRRNRNLVNEDNQELQSHLQRRHTTARRLTRLASRSSIRPPSVVGVDSPLPPPSTPMIQHQNYWFSDDSTKNRTSKPSPLPGPQDLEPKKSLAPDDSVLLRPRTDGHPPSESSWLRQPHLLPRPPPSRMVSLPGEINPLPEDELASLPGADEVIEQVQGVQALLKSARRRSMWRREMLQRRMNRTLSGGDGSTRNSIYSDAPPPVARGGSSSVHSVPEEPLGGNGKKPLKHHTAVDINSEDSADENLRKLVADLPKSVEEDSAFSQGYSSDYSTTGYSTDSTLPSAAPLLRPAFESIPEHRAADEDPLLSATSSGRRKDTISPKKC